MLQKQFRLSSRTLLRNARSLNTPHFLVRHAPNNLALSRFGFVVSKKVDRRAVIRNLVRRRLRSCVEERFQLFPSGHDIVFIVKKNELQRAPLCESVELVIQSLH